MRFGIIHISDLVLHILQLSFHGLIIPLGRLHGLVELTRVMAEVVVVLLQVVFGCVFSLGFLRDAQVDQVDLVLQVVDFPFFALDVVAHLGQAGLLLGFQVAHFVIER